MITHIAIALVLILLTYRAIHAAGPSDQQRGPGVGQPTSSRTGDAAEPFDLTLEDGREYKACRVRRVLPAGLVIPHQGGAARVPFEKLPREYQAMYGYDPVKVAAERAEKALAEKADLDAGALFTGLEFAVTNRNSYDWRNVELAVNPKVFSDGYTLKTPVIKAGEPHIAATQSANSDGQRLSPITQEPMTFGIVRDTPKGRERYPAEWR